MFPHLLDEVSHEKVSVVYCMEWNKKITALFVHNMSAALWSWELGDKVDSTLFSSLVLYTGQTVALIVSNQEIN